MQSQLSILWYVLPEPINHSAKRPGHVLQDCCTLQDCLNRKYYSPTFAIWLLSSLVHQLALAFPFLTFFLRLHDWLPITGSCQTYWSSASVSCYSLDRTRQAGCALIANLVWHCRQRGLFYHLMLWNPQPTSKRAALLSWDLSCHLQRQRCPGSAFWQLYLPLGLSLAHPPCPLRRLYRAYSDNHYCQPSHWDAFTARLWQRFLHLLGSEW